MIDLLAFSIVIHRIILQKIIIQMLDLEEVTTKDFVMYYLI